MTEAGDVVLPLPPNAPRVRPNAFTRWLGRTVLRLGGWRMVGAFPDVPKLVLIAVPHSSNWDGIWGFAAKLALGLELKILVGETVSRFPTMEIDGEPTWVNSQFASQLKTLPVRLHA